MSHIFVVISSKLQKISEFTPQFDVDAIINYLEVSGLHIFSIRPLFPLRFNIDKSFIFKFDSEFFASSSNMFFDSATSDELSFYFQKLVGYLNATQFLGINSFSTGNLTSIATDSIINLIEAIEYYTADELSDDFFLFSNVLAKPTNNFFENTALFSQINMQSIFREFGDSFDFVHYASYVTKDISNKLSLEMHLDYINGSIKHKLLGMYNSEKDDYCYYGNDGCFLTENIRYYGWADEATHWSCGESIDWYDVYSIDPEMREFVELLTTNFENSQGWQLDMTSLRDAETLYLAQAGTSRIFIPRPFTASPMYNALGTPWFLDYVHLSSWFFFMALFVLVMWVNIAMSIFSKNVESRQPMRETRGFSRAQTGDGITAVLPMTWSITMLMHASTHSINFDENTTGTIFTLTVIAYQWGWNYYFPRDITSIYWVLPKQVGHGSSDNSLNLNFYSKLLNYTKQNMLTRFSSEFRLANKMGKNVAANALSLFLKPNFLTSDFECSLPMFYSSVYLNNESVMGDVSFGFNSRKLGLTSQDKVNSRVVELLDESGLSVNSFDLISNFTKKNLYNNGINTLGNSKLYYNFNTWGLKLSDFFVLPAVVQNNFCNNLNSSNDVSKFSGLAKYIVREDMLRYRVSDALRNKNTAVLSSNRLLLINQNFNNWFQNCCSYPVLNIGVSNKENFLSNLSSNKSANFDLSTSYWFFLKNQTNFMFKKLQLLDLQCNTSGSAISPEYNLDVFGKYSLSLTNVSFNTWLFFFNLERYFTINASWLLYNKDVVLFSKWYSNLNSNTLDSNVVIKGQVDLLYSFCSKATKSNHTDSLSNLSFEKNKNVDTTHTSLLITNNSSEGLQYFNAKIFNKQLCLFNINYDNLSNSNLLKNLYATTIMPDINFMQGNRNWVNTWYTNQLFTFMSSDSSFLFFFSSLLTFDDYGLNFSPAVKEFSNRNVSYNTYNRYWSFKEFNNNATFSIIYNLFSVHQNTKNLSLFTFFDIASRELLMQTHKLPQINSLLKQPELTVSSQLVNIRQSAINQLSFADDVFANNDNCENAVLYLNLLFFNNIISSVTHLNYSLISEIANKQDNLFNIKSLIDSNWLTRGRYDFLNGKFYNISMYTNFNVFNSLITNIDSHNFNSEISFEGSFYLIYSNTYSDLIKIFNLYFITTQILHSANFATIFKDSFYHKLNKRSSAVLDITKSISILYNVNNLLNYNNLKIVNAVNPQYLNCLPSIGLVHNDFFKQSLIGDFFFPGSKKLIAAMSSDFVAKSENLLTSSSVWHNGVDNSKPIRSSSKNQDPALFCFKFENLPNNRIKFSNKSLFDWSNSWSSQTQIFGLPLYKLYRGCLVRKVNCVFWSTSISIETSELQQSIWAGNLVDWNQPVKNFFEARLVIPKLFIKTANNNIFTSNLLTPLLDKELVSFYKNNIISLPHTHEEFDINFVYQYWTPEINTTRRSDHSSRFKTTWNNFFSQKENLLVANKQVVSSPKLQSNAIQTQTSLLLFDKFFLLNKGLTNFSNITSNGIISKLNSRSLNLKNNMRHESELLSNNYFNNLKFTGEKYNNSFHFNKLNSKNDVVSFSSVMSILGMAQYTTNLSSVFLSENLLWADLWLYSQVQPSYKLSDIRTHASNSTNNYFTTKMHLLLSERSKLFSSVIDKAANVNSSTIYLSNNKVKQHILNLFQKDDHIDSSNSIMFTLKTKYIFTSTKNRSFYEFAKCDVGSMKRLRVTKGICLPVDYPIHIICGSKDVVHSWAIPGLGIKIDCIPGYNSHRRVMFRWRGIYWGQCMEVCGRYHHWMPILIRIVHRDVFLSWCLIYVRALNSRSVTSTQTKHNAVVALSWLNESNRNYQLNNTTKLLNFSHNSIFSGANESTVINF